MANKYLAFLAIITGFIVIHFLKPVLLPLVISLFLVAIILPVYNFLNKKLSIGVSLVLAYATLIFIVGGFITLAYLSVAELVYELPKYEKQFYNMLDNITKWLKENGLPAPKTISAQQLQKIITPIATGFYTAAGNMVLIIAFVVLMLPEATNWRAKLKQCFGKTAGKQWQDSASSAVQSFRKFLTISSILGLVNGLLTFILTKSLGLDFAMLWGLLAFILNYIPVIGAALLLIPVTLTAIMQFNDTTMITATFTGMAFIQFVMGNIIEPKYQGKYLTMSPVVLLFSVAFWGFLWGAAGAFLAVPLSHIIMVVCMRFNKTKPFACMLKQ